MANNTIFRVDKKSNFTVIDNEVFHIRNMSLRAKGLLILMLSLPPEWDYSINGLTAICKESRQTVRTILRELQDLGYLEIIKHNPSIQTNGRFSYEYIIHENSITPFMLDKK